MRITHSAIYTGRGGISFLVWLFVFTSIGLGCERDYRYETMVEGEERQDILEYAAKHIPLQEDGLYIFLRTMDCYACISYAGQMSRRAIDELPIHFLFVDSSQGELGAFSDIMAQRVEHRIVEGDEGIGQTPVFIIVSSGKVQTVDMLVNSRARVNLMWDFYKDYFK